MWLKYIPLLMMCLAIAACDWGGDGGGNDTDPGPYQLTYSLDDSFQVPHGNQPIRIALVRLTDGVAIEEASGTVSATTNPSFTFMPLATME